MPKLTATDGLASPESIKRVAITPDDIRSMDDESLLKMLADLRRDREVTSGGGRKPRKVREDNGEIIDDGEDISSDV